MQNPKTGRFARLLAITSLVITAFIYLSIYQSPEAAAEPAVYLIKGNSYEKEWVRVDSFASKGLYKSALDLTNQIYGKAKTENNAPQVVKAIMHRLKFEDTFVEQSDDRAIYALREELKTAKYPLKPVLHHILGNLYWQYYENNRWVIYQRSQTIKFTNDSVNTWDIKTLVDHTIEQYQLALVEKDSLQKTEGKFYADVIVSGTAPKELRPTLYDFLVYPTIRFFSSYEPGISRPADAFVIDNPAYFEPAQKFVTMNIQSTDTMSLKFYALKNIQELVRFHINDQTADAFIMADLERLNFLHANSVVPNKDSLYEDALRQLAANYGNNPYSGEVLYEVAQYHSSRAYKYEPLKGEQFRYENIRALELCNGVMKKFPGTLGAQKCQSLAEQITAKSIALTTEDVALPNEPFRGLVTWKNLTKIYFRVVKLEEGLESRYDYATWEEQVKEYLKKPIVEKWDQSFPDTKDYQSHSAEIKIPSLPPGHYAVLCSAIDSFPMHSNGIAIAEIWSSNISYLQRRMDDGSLEIFCYDRKNGAVLPNVNISMWEERYNYTAREYEMKKTASFIADKNGKLVIAAPANYRTFVLEFQTNKNHLYSQYNYQYKSYREPKRKTPQTFFFTDRAIYRPGQIVYFKGIIINSDGDSHELMKGKSTTVKFYDANYQEAAKLNLETNDYGSFSGSFTAPAAGLTGQMHIQNESGSVYFSVEEYKRPHFEVVVDPVKGAFRLNDTVKVIGHAKSFSGAAVDNAEVKYRVVRTARFPWWWYMWRGYYPQSSSVEIANGVVMTNDTGGFEVPFKAIPDRSVPRESEPVFMYTVYTDITDITGETHSSSGYASVGYGTIELNIPIAEMIEKSDTAAVHISVNNLNGQPEVSDVSIAIYKLQEPSAIYRTRMWSRPDQFVHTKEDWAKWFPEDPYDNENDRSTWKKGKQVYTSTINSKQPGKFYLDKKDWESGQYVIEANTKDKFGQPAKDMRYFTVYGGKEKTPYSKTPFEFNPVNTNVQPGQKAQVLVSTSLKDISMIYEVEHKNKIISREVIKMSNEMKLIEIPIEEKHRGNIAVHFSFVHNNRSYTQDQGISVAFENTNLEMEFETFRDKLIPGSQEEWKIKLKGPKGEKVMAEMVAAMYDASLDEFRGNYFSFYLYRSYYSNTYWNNDVQGTVNSQLWNEGWNPYTTWTERTYDYLNWFGYNMSYRNNWYGYMDGDDETISKSGEVGNVQTISGVAVSEESESRRETTKNRDDKAGGKKMESPAVPMGGNTAFADSVEQKENNLEGQSGKQLGEVKARSNLNETVFFFPHLETDSSGTVTIKFTMNEALTKWKFMAFAHTKDLKYGFIQKEVVTQKDLMVVPHAPRFLREGDEITMTAKVTNLSDTVQTGIAQLFLYDALTMKDITAQLMAEPGNAQRNFTAKKGQSAPLAWNLKVPQGFGAIQYKVVASAGNFTDGEENALPVLSNRMLVTETLPMPIRGGQTKEFRFDKLINQANGSKTMVNHRLTLEFTSNPAWYAVQALPYMME
ncbi:MAG TPA: alpha-2-macroglobulin family protein, partial [Bacteroidia bacterium]|nr:alpha-2-macroglobulin family protein [Bacteroidia bacterium]